MKKAAANITVMIYTHNGTNTAYLSSYKMNDVVSLYNYDLSFKITDIGKDFIVIDLCDDDKKFKIMDNKILLKEEIKIIDTSDATNIYIKLDSIEEVDEM